MSEIVKGFNLALKNNDSEIINAEVDVAVSRAVGVWLVHGDSNEDMASSRMIVGHRDEADAARAYAVHRKAQGWSAAQVYRLFPLLSTEPIAETQLQDGYEETWSAFSDAWIEIRL